MLAGGRPIDWRLQLRTPLWLRIRIHAYTRARYDAHNGNSTAANRMVWVRRDATRAMKYANGKARAASVTVTSVASPMVRPMISRYAGSLTMSRKLSRFQTSTICVVNVSMVQKAVISSRTSEVRYIRTNQASGGTSSRTERNHGRRQKRPCSGAAPRFLRSRPAVVTDTSRGALLCGDRSPGSLPLSVRNTGVGAVVAG